MDRAIAGIVALNIYVLFMYLSYRWGYRKRESAEFQRGFKYGAAGGKKTDFIVGYQEGYEEGKKTGFIVGYQEGYEEGFEDRDRRTRWAAGGD